MKIILRRNDSATSELLFLFNTYLLLTNKDTLKLSSLLEIMKVFGKNETTVRMSLSRASKAKILVNIRRGNEVSYALTPEGRAVIAIWNSGVKCFWERYRLRNKSWNEKWYFLDINFSEDKKDLKTVVIDKLRQLGFASMNKTMWINPYYLQAEVTMLINEYGIEDSVIQIYGDIQIHRDMNEFLNEVFCTGKLKVSYNDFVKNFKNKLAESKALYQSEEHSGCEKALPILHELGWNFFNIASGDTVLPKALLSEWDGEEAANIMKEFREILLKPINRYLQKFE